MILQRRLAWRVIMAEKIAVMFSQARKWRRNAP
jgi:hypothetical protein